MVINKIPLKTNFQFEKCSMAMAGHVWIKSSINNKYNQNKWDQNTAGICITITFPRQGRGLWLLTDQLQWKQSPEHYNEWNTIPTVLHCISLLDVLLVIPIGCRSWGLISLADDIHYANYLVFANRFADKRLGDYDDEDVLKKYLLIFPKCRVLLWNMKHGTL